MITTRRTGRRVAGRFLALMNECHRPLALAETQDGNGPAMEQLNRALPSDTSRSLVDAVIGASRAGEQAVTDAVAGLIAGALESDPGDEQS